MFVRVSTREVFYRGRTGECLEKEQKQYKLEAFSRSSIEHIYLYVTNWVM